MLTKLQVALEKVWTDEGYSKEFQKNKSVYRDLQHTLLHISKAVNRLQEMVEEADHSGANSQSFPYESLKKYLSDIISATRASSVLPNGSICIEKAVIERMRLKMGVDLEQ